MGTVPIGCFSHWVAVKKVLASSATNDLVYDACLKVDGDGDPSIPPRSAQLPTGTVFSDGGQGAPYVYQEQLAGPGNLPSSNGYPRCQPKPLTRVVDAIE